MKAPEAAASAPVSAASAPVSAAAVDIEDASSCAGCHGAVVEEWQRSMHSRAHQERDPVFAAMHRVRVEREGEQLTGACASCHSPLAPGAPMSAAGKAGVSCAACHNLAAVHPGKAGAAALERAPGGLLRSGRDLAPGASPAHPTGPGLPALADGSTLCLACHAVAKAPSGVTTCATGEEFAAGGGAPSCVSCHMPEVEGSASPSGARPRHRSHAFLGPHGAWAPGGDGGFLGSGLEVEARWTEGGAEVALKNTTPHAFPTGFPGRMAVVMAQGEDAAGQVIWRNIQGDPMQEHPEAVLNQVFVDAAGQPTLAAWSVERRRDARLQAGERRVISLAPPAEVQVLRVALMYRLMAPPLAKRLGLEEAPEAKPVKALERVLRR